jgi:hypothetical protein
VQILGKLVESSIGCKEIIKKGRKSILKTKKRELMMMINQFRRMIFIGYIKMQMNLCF